MTFHTSIIICNNSLKTANLTFNKYPLSDSMLGILWNIRNIAVNKIDKSLIAQSPLSSEERQIINK